MATYNEELGVLYRQYKESTKYALHWICSASKIAPLNPLPWLDLFNATKRIVVKKTEVPLSVIAHLKGAISGRRKVLEIYKGFAASNKEDDEKHETFVNRLEEILQMLWPLKAKLSSLSADVIHESTQLNRFSGLKMHDPNEIEETVQTVARAAKKVESPPSPPPEPMPDNLVLQDDLLGEWVELILFISSLDTAYEDVNGYWRQAARNELPIPLAAWLTTIVFHWARGQFADLPVTIHSDEKFVSRLLAYSMLRHSIKSNVIPKGREVEAGRIREGLPLLQMHRHLFYQCRNTNHPERIIPNAGARQKPADLILPDNPDRKTTAEDDQAVVQMLETMCKSLDSKERPFAVLSTWEKNERDSEPLLTPLRSMLNDSSSPLPFELSYGLEMLLSSYKAFLWQDEKNMTKQNCRIISLRLAKEVHAGMAGAVSAIKKIQDTAMKSLHPIEGDDAEHAVAVYVLESDMTELDGYTREQRFDLYHQSPWVAGSHMVKVLYNAFHAGFDICCNLGYVSAVLHMYNAFRQIKPPIPKITLLDQLCEMFLGPLFLGFLPKDNFCSHFRRAMGTKRSRETPMYELRGSDMSIPYPASQRKLDPRSLSAFYTLTRQNYEPDTGFWCKVLRSQGATEVPPASGGRGGNKSDETVDFTMKDIKAAGEKEFTGDLPIMRTNMFAIFCFCIGLLDDLSHIFRKNGGPLSYKPPGAALGFQMADAFLNALVGIIRDGEWKETLVHSTNIRCIRKRFLEIDPDISLSDYQWSI